MFVIEHDLLQGRACGFCQLSTILTHCCVSASLMHFYTCSDLFRYYDVAQYVHFLIDVICVYGLTTSKRYGGSLFGVRAA